ncbi:MAG: hypothetical protein KAS32_26015, partial [Candidatus Peribacteraceae bacterium]|nr:hypothetical protein [Candidatus Peribacteraceae bacterium]
MTNTSANEIFLSSLSSNLGVSFGDSLIFWFVGILVMLLIFTILQKFTGFTKSVSLILGFSFILLLDTISSYGTYVFELPFFGTHEFTRLVMTFSLIDYIFEFHLFNPALEVMSHYTVTDVITTLPVKIIALALSVGDSLFQIIIFAMTAYYIISLIEYQFNREFEWQIPVSIIAGAIPVSIYAVFFSNPFHEYEMANIQASNVINFLTSAPNHEIIYVATLGFFSFLIVLLILSSLTQFTLSSVMSIRPKMQEQMLFTNYMSVAFLLTLLYTFLYI